MIRNVIVHDVKTGKTEYKQIDRNEDPACVTAPPRNLALELDDMKAKLKEKGIDLDA